VIHGDSAGGGSIAFQLTAYGGHNQNLFIGGISESPFLPTHRTVAESEFQFDRFAANVNCSGTWDTLSCLRSKDTATLQSADVVSIFPGGPSNVEPDWYFLPVVDGTFSPDYLYNMLEQGRVTRVPVIVGDDTDEGTGFSPNATSPEQFLQFIQANYPRLNDKDLAAINKTYPLGSVFPLHDPWFTPTEMAYGEATFICPGIEITKSLARFTSPSKTWNYRYNVYDEADESIGLGVPHVSEKPAIFGPGNAGDCTGCSYLTYNAPIVPIVMNYWISFVRTLNPNIHKDPSAPVWQSWGTHGGQRLKIQLDATVMEPVPEAQLQRCELWKSLASISEQ
jgi:acetylcholinesterase